MTPEAMFGLLQAFPFTRRLALVGSCMEVNGGGDVFRAVDSGEIVDFPISTSGMHETVQHFEVLVVHFYVLPDDDIVMLSRWLSRASKLTALYVKATNDTDILATQKLVSNCTDTLKKLNIHIYDGGLWSVSLDLKACQCLQSLSISCTDCYGHMLVDILGSVKLAGAGAGANLLQINLSIHMRTWIYPNYHEQITKMYRSLAEGILGISRTGDNALVRVSVMHRSDLDWTRTKFKDETDYRDWIKSDCFKEAVKVMGGRFMVKVASK
ncbi:uncharacterized protein EV420DRAFT_1654355 [Desarmillaria tabescens]|uniref:Uncharacterized protein n=1 Tax=Armillaria tabescens TaxID=1929756 RepID=A0AA39MHB0_ARMTA|nr:uncharacterized protein EV420DRAFT_1654355 [Desarmillaria tabescens]KAK0433833.1 hypothetical protein EV420DRAFT_1654355 [Desarmillaria tabescens]